MILPPTNKYDIKRIERELDSLVIKKIVKEAQLVVDRWEQARDQIPQIKKFIDKYIFSYV